MWAKVATWRPDSLPRGIAPVVVLGFDLAGLPHGTGAQAAGAYR